MSNPFGWLFALMRGESPFTPSRGSKRRPPRPSKGKRKPHKWLYPGVGMMLAWTRSEARAIVKKHLGVKRLPPGRTCQKIGEAEPKIKRT